MIKSWRRLKSEEISEEEKLQLEQELEDKEKIFKPIFGSEVYVARRGMENKTTRRS